MNNSDNQLTGTGAEITGSQEPGEIVLQMIDAWRRLDLEDAMSHMADDAVFLPDPKAEPVRGRDAIRALWAYYMSLFSSYACELQNILMSDRLVFVERVERIARVDGQTVVLPVASVFELNEAGKIVAWRDYWDPSMAIG
jgi:limonene-1,2-epoxide hydrolase